MDVRPTIQEVVADPWFHEYREETGYFHAHAREADNYSSRGGHAQSQATGQLRKSGSASKVGGRDGGEGDGGREHGSVASTATGGGGANGLSHQNLSSSHTGGINGLSHQAKGDSVSGAKAEAKGVGSVGAGTVGAGSSANGNGSGEGGHGLPPNVREEAVLKLEKLGYQREEIFRQLKDENSHLSKLYTRFVKALNAWGK